MHDGTLGFAGEESAGASFLRKDGPVWTTEKDGLLLGLLAAEITACSGSDPSAVFRGLTREMGESFYQRTDAPATAGDKARLKVIRLDQVAMTELAGEPVVGVETTAPGSGPLGGVRVRTQNGWFTARPSGTEAVSKIYAESFLGAAHLTRIQNEARTLVNGLFYSSDIKGR